jgi:hypothetical protein
MATTTTTNKCKKCGCEDKFMPSPAPCPTPIGCPTPEPCSEVMDAQCVIYTGANILCDTDVVVTTNDTVAEALESIVDYVCNNQPTVPAYKVYTALLTQTAGDIPTNPIVTVLENTIGNIIWTRVNAGQYVGTLSGAFVSAKTALFIQKSVGLAKNSFPYPKDLWIEYTNTNTITIYTTDDTFLIDGVLNNTTIEIRVYN